MIPVQFYMAWPYVLAFLVAAAIPTGAVLQYRLARSLQPEVRIVVLFVLVSLGALLTVALTPRDLNERTLETAGRLLATDYDEGFAASRYLNMFLVGTGFVELLRGWLASRAASTPDPARPILHALVAFYVGTIVIQAVGSAHPDFSYHSLYVPILLVAVYYQQIRDIDRIVKVAKLSVLALMVASLAGMAIKPDFVLHRPEAGLIPGVDFRLFGMTPHANALGPIALVGIILEFYLPSSSRVMRLVQWLAAAAVMVLAQSKTAWVAGMLAVALVAFPLGLIPSADPSRRSRNFQRAVASALLCIAALIVVLIGLSTVDVFGYLERTAQIDTLSGRTQIWDLTLDGWRESLLFGYGREIWGLERMLKFRLFHVGQAHNQFIQTLGDSGLAGLAVLIYYLGTLVVVALRQFVESRGVTFSLLILVLARCVTEAPLRTDGVLSWPMFTNALLIVLLCHYVRAEQKFLVGDLRGAGSSPTRLGPAP